MQNEITKQILELQNELARLAAVKKSLLTTDFKAEFPKTSNWQKLAVLGTESLN